LEINRKNKKIRMKKTHGRQKLHGKKNRERKKLKNLTLRAGPSRPK